MESPFESHIDVTAYQRAPVDLLCAETGFTRTRIKQVMQKGAVWLTHGKHTQRLRRASKVLSPGDQLHLYYDEKVLNQVPEAAELVADEQGYSVWNKPAGMLSHGSKWGDHCSITRWAEQHLQPERTAFLVHRLDRAAAGLILVAHTKKMAAALAKLFHDRAVEKRYQVLVEGKFPTKPKPYLIDQELDGRAAISRINRLEFDPESGRSLLDVAIETGRKHQVRRHLAAIGFPVVGDRLYGKAQSGEDLRLKASYLSFISPASGEKKVYSSHDS
ncbi:RluA family pseudouridine synthase [endosymbiont of Lamellibrachia barhami]|uniref:RluA family pseudouridine synthase n=1 Tax=endosymbiont of Lamellibrachia barhami TaxID=205975 RepID=UPI0015AA1884|nr:RluA family pseudouridine synthase [endosymbiont of Lamellibrachia barhami]